MAKAQVDPDELLKFASALKRFNEATKAELGAVDRQFRRLRESWQDEEQERFAESFEHMVRVLSRFLEDAERQAPALVRKAEHIRDYLRA